jgi:tripartite-type tricarboxylate transporter receptor subunit TctC
MASADAAQPVYPDRPIRLIIGSAPGSGPDIISRVLAERLYKAWGQRIVVDARPGVAVSSAPNWRCARYLTATPG